MRSARPESQATLYLAITHALTVLVLPLSACSPDCDELRDRYGGAVPGVGSDRLGQGPGVA